MKKIIFVLSIALGLFATEGFAQSKPSKKELMKLWKSMSPEQQTAFLSNSRQWVTAVTAQKKVDTTSVKVEAASKEASKLAANAKDAKAVAPAKVTPATPPAKTVADKKEVAPAPAPAKPVVVDAKPAQKISVQPAPAPVKPADNQPLVLAPSNAPMMDVAVTPTSDQQDNRPEYLKKVEGMAKTTVKWDSELFDFGKIKQGEVAKHTFKFKNTGSTPLLVSFVKPSCGCTTPNWTKEEVAPGGEGTVEIHFNTAGKSGNQQKSITVFANTDPVILNLQFKGEIIADPTPATPATVHSHDGHNHEGHNH
ncbi:MAG: DUF1573 domain-containing protein [Bacteroidia bacterium]